MKRIALSILLILIFIIPLWAGEVYIWTDEKGVKHITDTPPPKPKTKVETMHSADAALRLRIMDTYGVDPNRFQDIYEFADALSPKMYKKFVDKNKDNEAKGIEALRGLEYTTDGTGKITKVISKYEMERYRREREERDEQKRRDDAARLKAYLDYKKQSEIERKMRWQQWDMEFKQLEIESKMRRQQGDIESKQSEIESKMQQQQREMENKMRQQQWDMDNLKEQVGVW